ncbi:MAG: ABC transporter permease [Anaerolineae bacterium]|jgi:peptide/nickel transport system permease protein|nr:ABC transporter permease [Anaerolineae bacterium]MDX9833310.1 ABC transporter permease [Anaerolineae bacterium]
MRTYLVKRLLMTILVLVLVTVYLTLLIHIVPGDPAKAVLGPRSNPDLIAKVRAAMDLDKPVWEQLGLALWRLARLDMGTDVFTGRAVQELVGAALPHTLILAWTSLALAAFIGIPLGVYSSTHPDSWLDRVTALLSISFITVPSYVGGLFLLLIFAVQLKIMPAIGLGREGDVMDYIKHLILPATALAITWVGYLARLVRASMLEVLNQTYVRAAMAAGLSRSQVFYKYALKNAIIPTVAILGIGVGNLMAGAVFVELIFTRPGMGSLIYSAIQARNYPVVRASVLVVAVLFVAANLLADLIYTYLDPRIQLGKVRG